MVACTRLLTTIDSVVLGSLLGRIEPICAYNRIVENNSKRVRHLWNPETGIVDLAEGGLGLGVDEVRSIAVIWGEQQNRLKGSTQLTQFTKQLSREWAIETGIIENLYEIERGVTRTLIEHGFQAALLGHGSTNKPRDYVIQLLRDQEDALEGLFDFVSKKRDLSTSYIRELHAALCRNQKDVDGVDDRGNITKTDLLKGAWKLQPNYPERDGTVYMYCPPEHVASEMDRLVDAHEKHRTSGVPPEVQAAWLHHAFTIIHPFQDGNGRVARALASLVFIQQGLFPLVVTRDDKVTYLDALEAADGGDIKPLVDLFARLQRSQFRKATALSENILIRDTNMKQALQFLKEKVVRRELDRQKDLERVFVYSEVLERIVLERFESLSAELEGILKGLDSRAKVSVDRSDKETGYYFRGQIVHLAKKFLHYYADTFTHATWVRLKLGWSRRAQVVLAFHSTGAQFSGVLVIAPFLEFRDEEGDADPHATLVNLAQEPFEFYFNEDREKLIDRFDKWFETVLTALFAELVESV